MRKVYLAVALCVALFGCGDNIVDLPEEEKSFLKVRLGCPNGGTVFSIEGDAYVRDAAKEQSVDIRTGNEVVTFTVVPDTRYTVRANHTVKDGPLVGSTVVTSGGFRERLDVGIVCN